MGQIFCGVGVLATLIGATIALQPLSDTFASVNYEPGTVVTTNASAAAQILPFPYPYDSPREQAANTSGLFPMRQCHGVTIEEATIDQLQGYLSSGALTSAQLAICYWQRAFQTQEYIK